MVMGFRVLDQFCDVAGAEENSPASIGEMRVLFFLEDLGPSPAVAAAVASSYSATPSVAFSLPHQFGFPDPHRPVTETKAIGGDTQPEEAPDIMSQAPGASAARDVVEGLKAIRKSPAYSAAYALEVWRRQEEERARARLAESEAELREHLEEEHRQRELARAQEFRQRQTEFRDLEVRAKKKLLELQQREAVVAQELKRAKAFTEEATRRADSAILSVEEAVRWQRAELSSSELEHGAKHRRWETKLQQLETELQDAETELKLEKSKNLQLMKDELEAVEPPHGAQRTAQLRTTSSTANELAQRHESGQLRMQLCEQELRCATLEASRDHFRRKVEELCKRLLQEPGQVRQSSRVDSEKKKEKRSLSLSESGSPPAPLRTPSPSREHSAGKLNQSSNSPTFLPPNLAWLQQQRAELLESGFYSDVDPAIQALDAKLKQAQEAQL
ncbi:unnamed protein product [Polarella glacialis]|nr:unnamed protein product [Polarella glacialis]CAE8622098.1 unnamed protein product [Polarella glacialis]